MRKIAIVEDTVTDLDFLSSNLKSYYGDDGKYEITPFKNGRLFLDAYKPIYDIVFMDIDMPEVNGMDTAIQLRAMDSSVTLVFVTNLKQYAITGYKVDAIDYLLKPVAKDRLYSLMDKIEKRLAFMTENDVVIQSGKNFARVNESDILYLESQKHYVIYHTKNKDISVFGSMKEESERLNPDHFAFCNNCYFVNLNQVKMVDKEFVYIGSARLEMSRRKKQEFLLKLSNTLRNT